MKVAVIGVGGTGSAALRFLAEAGHVAVGFEQFRAGHEHGSSHGESRIIRYLYTDPFYTELIQDAYPLWKELEARSGRELLVRCGGIFIGRPNDTDVQETVASLTAADCPFEILDSIEAARRFPAFQLSPDEVAVFQQDTGFLRASDCVAANVRLARRAGALLREETAVLDVASVGDSVQVRTADGSTEHFDRAIVAAGPWMGKLLRRLGMPLRVTRQYAAYVETPAEDPALYAPGTFPVWVDVGSAELFYGVPRDGRRPGIKMATHAFGPSVDPDAVDDVLLEEWNDRISRYASHRFPTLSGKLLHTIRCLYTVTPDEDFILDSAERGIWLVSGCSGHGFKFTILLGKIAADLATGIENGRDISRFSMYRFSAITEKQLSDPDRPLPL